MLGIVRFVLALLVVMNHLWDVTANKVGANAVIGFYCISGFLMTRVLCEVYVGIDGKLRYFVNRFLRIFPCYFLIVGATLLGLAAVPHAFATVSATITFPQSSREWFENLTLINLIYAPLRLVPPAWSLSVEWVFYIVLGLGLSIKRSTTLLWWAVSALYTVKLILEGADFADRYTPPLAASLFFATGALIYHSPIPRQPITPSRLWWASFVLFCWFPLIARSLGLDPHMSGYYGAFLLFIILFVNAIRSQLSTKAKRWDKFLGELAYPVFLSHYLCGAVTIAILGQFVKPRSFIYFLIATGICLAISAAVVKLVDPIIDRLRGRLRPAAAYLS